MMKSKKKFILLLAVFIVLIAGSAIAYQALKDKGQANVLKEANTTKDTDKKNASSEQTDNANDTSDSNEGAGSSSMQAPDFSVYDVSGKEVSLHSLFGKPIVLNFWNSNCPPCKQEMPEFEEVYQSRKDDITFVMVDTVGFMGETLEAGKKYVEEGKFTFPVYYDTSQEAVYTYGVSAFPTTYFLDKDGNVVTGAQGAIDKATLEKGISMIE